MRDAASRNETIVAFLIFLTVATAVGNMSVTLYKHFDFRGAVGQYVKIYEGERLDEVRPPCRYRALVPLAARFAPPLPSIFVRDPKTEQNQRILFKFAVTNLVGLTLAATFLFLLMRALRFERLECLLGGLLFLASYYPLIRGAIPLVDAWAYACLAGCLYALLRGKSLLLFVLFSVGVFVKETTFLVLLAALLLRTPRPVKLARLARFAPAALAYLVFRFLLYPAEEPTYWAASVVQYSFDLFVSGARLAYLLKGLLAFGFLWLFAVYGWAKIRRDRDHPLVRWAPLVPILLIAPFLLVVNIGRMWTYAFPIVIPLGVLGIREFLDDYGCSNSVKES